MVAGYSNALRTLSKAPMIGMNRPNVIAPARIVGINRNNTTVASRQMKEIAP
jgi:hypothetical protein